MPRRSTRIPRTRSSIHRRKRPLKPTKKQRQEREQSANSEQPTLVTRNAEHEAA